MWYSADKPLAVCLYIVLPLLRYHQLSLSPSFPLYTKVGKSRKCQELEVHDESDAVTLQLCLCMLHVFKEGVHLPSSCCYFYAALTHARLTMRTHGGCRDTTSP